MQDGKVLGTELEYFTDDGRIRWPVSRLLSVRMRGLDCRGAPRRSRKVDCICLLGWTDRKQTERFNWKSKRCRYYCQQSSGFLSIDVTVACCYKAQVDSFFFCCKRKEIRHKNANTICGITFKVVFYWNASSRVHAAGPKSLCIDCWLLYSINSIW